MIVCSRSVFNFQDIRILINRKKLMMVDQLQCQMVAKTSISRSTRDVLITIVKYICPRMYEPRTAVGRWVLVATAGEARWDWGQSASR